MRIERVEAHVFGPLKGETLELAPGMNVLHGPNEAGKSSWHAALYAGLCGRRRGPGGGSREDRAFAERHRPWHSERWEVSVVVELADGRRIELRQDLAGGVDCRATDLALGRDVSDEVIFEGAPDGARWLGLNRRTLPATIYVRQADVLGLLSDPDQLQETLQRAAATGGADATAQRALEAIASFRRERIGLDRRNSTRPLRRAIEAVERARAEARAAAAAHEEYVQLVAERDAAREQAAAAQARLASARAERQGADATAQAEQQHAQASALEARVRRAAALAARTGDGPVPEPATHDAVVEQAAAALAAYEARPPAPALLEGEDAVTLAAALTALPEVPEGDVEPAPVVEATHEAWAAARQALRLHEHSRPQERPIPDTGGLSAADLRTLAATLDSLVPEVDRTLWKEVENLREAAGRQAGRKPAVAFVLAALFAVAAAASALGGAGSLAAGLAAAALAAAAGGLLARRRGRPLVPPTTLATAETRLAVAQARRADAIRAREAAGQPLARAGLPADAAQARGLAALLEAADADAERLAAWKARSDALAREHAEAATRLWEALRSRGERLGDAPDPGMAFHAYVRSCRTRAHQAAQAGRRADLEQRLRASRAAEADARDRQARRQAATERLRAAARAAGVDPSGEAEAVVERLAAWLRQQAQARRGQQARREAWVELQHVLDGRAYEDLATELERLRATLPALPAMPGRQAPTDEELDALAAGAGDADRRLAHLEGRLADRQRDLPSVAEAEEVLVQAEADLTRLRTLDETLEVTCRFLEAARDRVHRSIAPQLKTTVEQRLPAITGARYEQVAVDPATLTVHVRARGAPWRPATSLSHGTAEQVYLLLRLAMAQHLVTTGETAPLLLDDVTVQCDAARTGALLDLLHDLSGERQVILFSQEDAVLAWAEANLRGPRDALTRLEPAGVAL